MALIQLPLETNAFEGKSGRKYIIQPDVSVFRFQKFEQLQIESQLLLSVSGFAQEVKKIRELQEKPQFASASHALINLENGAARVLRGDASPLLYIATLFICTDDEPQDEWSEAAAMEKIKDWGEISASFFLTLAARFTARYIQDFNSDSLNFLLQKMAEQSPEEAITKKKTGTK